MKRVGSKAEVWHSKSRFTPGGLTKKDLIQVKGRIMSRKKHALGKKAIKHLFALGYKPKKGTFKLMRKSMAQAKPKKGKSRKSRGGAYGVVSHVAEDFSGAQVPVKN